MERNETSFTPDKTYDSICEENQAFVIPDNTSMSWHPGRHCHWHNSVTCLKFCNVRLSNETLLTYICLETSSITFILTQLDHDFARKDWFDCFAYWVLDCHALLLWDFKATARYVDLMFKRWKQQELPSYFISKVPAGKSNRAGQERTYVQRLCSEKVRSADSDSR